LKIKKRYLVIALIVVALVISLFSFTRIYKTHKLNILSENIEQKVSRIVELSTVRYNYTDIVSYNDNIQVNGLNIPFTNKSFLIKYSGYIKAGIDLESLKFNVIDSNNIKLTMSKAKVLENVIVEEEVEFFNEKDGLFNKLNFKDLYSVLIGEKEKTKAEAIKNGLLNEAEKNGEEIIRSLLEEMGFKKIDIEYK
jgi:hypothetical protein